MQVIMADPMERELLRMRRDAEFDRRTEVNAARREGERIGALRAEKAATQKAKKEKVEIARGAKRKGYALSDISELFGLTLEEVAAL